MLSINDYSNAYQAFYSEMRKYVWSFDVVELLAELETALYDAFSDHNKVKSTFYDLEREIKGMYKDDPDLESAANALKDLLEEDQDTYLPLYQVTEAIDEDQKED